MQRERIHPVVFAQLQEHIAAIAQAHELAASSNFADRADALRELKERIIGRIEQLLDGADKAERKQLRGLKREALRAQSTLDAVDAQLFASMREQIRAGAYSKPALRQTFASYIEPCQHEEWSDPPRYDHLDTFVDGLLQIEAEPRARSQPEPGMVGYQPTPARIVLDMLERLSPARDDVLYDLGSGLGRVVLLAAFLCDTPVKGVEYEPAYCAYAQRRAHDLALSYVTFINADAREVNYADGTIFFLYTPFKGKILQRVLELLRYESGRRRIRVCTYGPGTLDVLDQDWLASIDDCQPDIHRVAIFESR